MSEAFVQVLQLIEQAEKADRSDEPDGQLILADHMEYIDKPD